MDILLISDLGDGKMAEKTVDGRAKRSLIHILKSVDCKTGMWCPAGKIVAEQDMKRR